MKYFTTISALVAVVYGACEAGGDMVCKKDDEVCLYRFTADVADTKDKDYKKVIKKDKQAVKGGEKYECFKQKDADALLETSGK